VVFLSFVTRKVSCPFPKQHATQLEYFPLSFSCMPFFTETVTEGCWTCPVFWWPFEGQRTDFTSPCISFIETCRLSWNVFIPPSLGSNTGGHVTERPLGTVPVLLPDKCQRYCTSVPHLIVRTVRPVCVDHYLRFHSRPYRLHTEWPKKNVYTLYSSVSLE
jgi:hypothetical protein